MNQYLLLIHRSAGANGKPEDWSRFFAEAKASGLFKGGSALGDRMLIGRADLITAPSQIVGYMRFDADDKSKLLNLLQRHPVVVAGGCIELCEMPKT